MHPSQGRGAVSHGPEINWPRRREAYAVVFLLAVAVFLAGLAVPYRVDSDTGFQLRGLQQWLRGESPNVGTIRLPDAADLSKDTLLWSSWWPPGFPVVYTPLAAAGLSLAGALRATSFLVFLFGAWGWLRLADRLPLSRTARLLYAVSLAVYAVTSGGAVTLRSADNLSFAAAPWMALFVLRLARPSPRLSLLLLCGMALGTAYFLKYTLFLVALSLAGWLGLYLLFASQGTAAAKALRIAVLGVGLALPVAGLVVLNAWESGNVTESATGTRSVWRAEDMRPARPLPVALGVAGGPGMGLFQSHVWMTHLSFFSDRFVPFVRGFDPYRRLLLESFLGLFGTAALAWGLWRGRDFARASLPPPDLPPVPTTPSQGGGNPLSLALVTVCGFYLALGVISLVVRYNYLANEPRYAVAAMPLLQPFVLMGWLAAASRHWRGSRFLAWMALGIFFFAPLLFVAVDFAKNEIGRRWSSGYTASATGLYAPEISPRSVPRVQAAVAAVVRSPRDVVVLAGTAGTGAAFLMWLESPWRTLPESTFSLPLGARYLRATDLHEAVSPLTSSRPLRVVLVAARSLDEGGWRTRLQGRFPQARTWTAAPPVPDANVEIWYSDLEAH
jgi:hypothetical protein